MNWGTVIVGAVLTALALVNDQLHWLPPLQFAGLAIMVLLVVVAPRPAWVALVIAGIAGYAVRSAGFLIGAEHYLHEVCLNSIAICGDQLYSRGDDAEHLLQLPLLPASLVALGVLGWAGRRLSWRVAVAGVAYGLAVEMAPYYAPLVLFAAAAAALGPRKDVRYLAGVAVLALALVDQRDASWKLVLTIVAITAGLALVIWALAKKDGVNGVVALVSLAAATLSPFLTAGVLLVASAIRQPLWFKLFLGALGLVAVDAAIEFSQPVPPVQYAWIEGDLPPQPVKYSLWLVLAGVLLAGAAVAALHQHRHRVETDQANG
ncbi:MAG TPA: hypothetical protein VF821_02405 [Lentzea sp.]